MVRWKAPLLLFHITTTTKSSKSFFNPLHNFPNFPHNGKHQFSKFRSFSALPFAFPNYTEDLEYMKIDGDNSIDQSFGKDCIFMPLKNEGCRKMPVKAYFLCTSMNVKAMQAEYLHYLVTPSSGLSNHIALRFVPSQMNGFAFAKNESHYQYMVVFQYGSTVLFNVEDHEVEDFLQLVDGMVEEFAHINCVMEKTGNFTMERKELFKLVGKANSNLADVILKVGIFERSEIAWRNSKYGQILDYLQEYEVSQRFGNLNFKLKFVEHNIHFLQEVFQNHKSDLLEWCIIVLLSIENVISFYEIVRESGAIPI